MLPTIMSAISATGSWLPCISIAVLLVFLSNSGWGLLVFAVGFAAYGYLGLTSTSILLFRRNFRLYVLPQFRLQHCPCHI